MKLNIKSKYVIGNILSYFDNIKIMKIVKNNKFYLNLFNFKKDDYCFLYLINLISSMQGKKINNTLRNRMLTNLVNCYNKYDNCFFFVKKRENRKYVHIITKSCKEYAISYNLRIFLYNADYRIIKSVNRNSISFYDKNYIFFFFNDYDNDEFINLSNAFSEDESLTYFMILKNKSKFRSTYNMFHGCTNLVKVNMFNLETENLEIMSGMFAYCNNLKMLCIKENMDLRKVKFMNEMFYKCEKMENINMDLFMLRDLIDMEMMFTHCYNLLTFKMTNFITNNVIRFDRMFACCFKLKHIILGNDNFVVRDEINEVLNKDEIPYEERILYKMRMFHNCYKLEENYHIMFKNDIILKLIEKNESMKKKQDFK